MSLRPRNRRQWEFQNNMIIKDSATQQSMQWIINAMYNQRSLQSTTPYTVWIYHQIWGQYIFGARTFPTVNIRGSELK
jgi:hypothetical protein